RNAIGCADSSQLLRRAGCSDESRIERCQKSLELIRAIPFGIHSDVEDLKIACRGRQFFSSFCQVCEGRRTDAGTVGIAKAEGDHRAAVVRERTLGAIRSSEREIGSRSRRVKDTGPELRVARGLPSKSSEHEKEKQKSASRLSHRGSRHIRA